MAGMLLKDPCKMTLVRKPGEVSDLSKRIIRSIEIFDRLFNAQFADIISKGEVVEIFREFAGKVSRVDIQVF